MVFEYILKQNGLDPQKDLSIDQSIDFGSTAAAFAGDDSADFTVEFEPWKRREPVMWLLRLGWSPDMCLILLTAQKPAI